MKIKNCTILTVTLALASCDGRTVDGAAVTAAIKADKPKLGFVQKREDPVFEGLTMLGDVSRHGVGGFDGKILRTLRLRNVADAVEERYCLPKGTVLAMVAHESGGADLVTNGQDDGGAGFCHMQPVTAKEFGLRVYKDAGGLRNFPHGRELRALIAANRSDRKKLIVHDDRFHPILNLDCVGRMLAWHMNRSDRSGALDPFQKAIRAYSGSKNYPVYWARVQELRRLLASKAEIAKVEARFNAANPNFRINGKPAKFWDYVRECERQNENYGLAEYRKLPRYAPQYAEAMLAKHD